MPASTRQLATRTAWSLLAAALLAYPADWATWRLRHSPTDQVTVTKIVVATLKGNKEEYYPDGTDTVTCTHSLFPQTGANPCWWTKDHQVIYER